MRTSAFGLDVLPQTYNDGAAGSFSLQTRELRDGYEVAIAVADARDLRAAYIDLSYDAASLHPVAASATDLLAPTDRLLTLHVIDQPGTVSTGQAVIGDGAGFSGSGVVARVLFKSGPARAAAAAPQTNGSRGTVSWNPATRELSWRYLNQGDYDQNGEVNVADLGPLGKHFMAPGPYAANSIQEVVDGDGNGQINLADITPIAGNFNAMAEGYKVYKSTNPDDIPTVNSAPSSVPEVADIPFSAALGDKTLERLRFSYTMGATERGDYFWVRPYDDDGASMGTAFGSAGGDDILTIRIVNPPPTGDGSQGNPYVMDALVEYEVEVMHSTIGDVSTNVLTEYTLVPDTLGTLTNADAILRINDDFIGDFTVSGTHAGQQAQPEFIYCKVQQDDENQPPTVGLDALPTSGNVPLFVDFTANATDDGTIVSYEWDWESDGIYDENTGGSNVAFHTFETAGDHDVTVRATDDGGLSATATATIQALPGDGNEEPWAAYLADRFTGEAPLTVNLDGTYSEDFDGFIVKYEWDFDGDGTWDDASGPIVSHTFGVAGYYDCWLRVTDDDGATNQISHKFSVGMDAWEVTSLATSSYYGAWPQLCEVEGQPAITYFWEYDSWEGPWEARFQRFDGSAWTSPLDISADLALMSITDVGIVDGNPAAVFQAGGENGGLQFVRASDSLGAAWGTPVKIGDGIWNGYGQLQIVGGNPAVVFANSDAEYNTSVMYVRASNAQGSSWPAPAIIPGTEEFDVVKPTFDLLNGKPAAVWFDEDTQRILMFQAEDALGDTWGAERELSNDMWSTASLFAGSKTPALLWQNGNAELMFSLASDMTGDTFNTPLLVDNNIEQYADDYSPRLAWVDSAAGVVPALAYFKTGEVVDDMVETHVMYRQAANPEGTEWLEPEIVHTGLFGMLQIDIIAIDGKPHLAFCDGFTSEVLYARPKQ